MKTIYIITGPMCSGKSLFAAYKATKVQGLLLSADILFGRIAKAIAPTPVKNFTKYWIEYVGSVIKAAPDNTKFVVDGVTQCVPKSIYHFTRPESVKDFIFSLKSYLKETSNIYFDVDYINMPLNNCIGNHTFCKNNGKPKSYDSQKISTFYPTPHSRSFFHSDNVTTNKIQINLSNFTPDPHIFPNQQAEYVEQVKAAIQLAEKKRLADLEYEKAIQAVFERRKEDLLKAFASPKIVLINCENPRIYELFIKFLTPLLTTQRIVDPNDTKLICQCADHSYSAIINNCFSSSSSAASFMQHLHRALKAIYKTIATFDFVFVQIAPSNIISTAELKNTLQFPGLKIENLNII